MTAFIIQIQNYIVIAQKANSLPLEKFSNLFHHVEKERVKKAIDRIDRQSARGSDDINVEIAIKHCDWPQNIWMQFIRRNTKRLKAVEYLFQKRMETSAHYQLVMLLIAVFKGHSEKFWNIFMSKTPLLVICENNKAREMPRIGNEFKENMRK